MIVPRDLHFFILFYDYNIPSPPIFAIFCHTSEMPKFDLELSIHHYESVDFLHCLELRLCWIIMPPFIRLDSS
jgi:hypothetical protein